MFWYPLCTHRLPWLISSYFCEPGRFVNNQDGHKFLAKLKGCAVKNWTTFEGVYFNNGMEQTKKKLICTNSVALRKRWAIYKRVKTPLSAACPTFVRRTQNAFRKSPTSMFLAFKWSLFLADQFLMLPSCQHTLLVSGCPKNAHLDAAGGHSAGLRSLNHPACYAPEELRALVASFLGLGRLHGLSSSCGMSCLPPWRPQCW